MRLIAWTADEKANNYALLFMKLTKTVVMIADDAAEKLTYFPLIEKNGHLSIIDVQSQNSKIHKVRCVWFVIRIKVFYRRFKIRFGNHNNTRPQWMEFTYSLNVLATPTHRAVFRRGRCALGLGRRSASRTSAR